MDASSLQRMRCPLCYGPLAVAEVFVRDGAAIDTGVVSCQCSRFPVVSGILVLAKRDAHGIMACLAPFDEEKLHAHLGRFHGVAPALLGRDRPRTLFEAIDVASAFLASGGADQLVASGITASTEAMIEWFWNVRFRQATPTHTNLLIAALALAPARPEVVLDVGAGVGHFGAMVQRYARPRTLYAFNRRLVELVLSRWLFDAPESVCRIVGDAVLPLPFHDRQLDAIVSSDAIHYMDGKAGLFEQMARVARPGASYAFAHLHNGLSTEEPFLGFALAPEVWSALLDAQLGAGGALFSDGALRGPFIDGTLDLAVRHSPAELRAARSFTFFKSPRPLALDGALLEGGLEETYVNSIYVMTPEEGGVRLDRRAVGPVFDGEHGYGGPPPTLRLTRADLEDPRRRAALRRSGVLFDATPRLSESGRALSLAL